MLRKRLAVSEALRYIGQFPDLPSTTYPVPRQFVQEESCRIFEAKYTDQKLRKAFTLLEFTVADDRTVTLRRDNRDAVRATLAQSGRTLPDNTFKPINAIAQFRNAFADPNFERPPWFLSIELNPESRRSDAIARIESLDGSHAHVPVIVFRSKSEKASYFKQLRMDRTGKRIGIIIPFETKPARIRKLLFATLSTFRSHRPR